MKVLVTGSNGQLGKSIQKIAISYPKLQFTFTDVEDLDITNYKQVLDYFHHLKPDYCINAAAYTQVDKAETEVELNKLINITGPSNLAKASKAVNTKLIHISSDYVYNNNSEEIMTEESPTNPKGQYAVSKLKGEIEIKITMDAYFIIRTSWLYSEFGNNFVKTMLRLGKERKSLNVVNDQIGSPTYATDLADTILHIVINNNNKFGTYNYSNEGFTSWYNFTKKIFSKNNIDCEATPIPSTEYPTIAPRPLNSRMSKEKIIFNFELKIPLWSKSLDKCLRNIKFS